MSVQVYNKDDVLSHGDHRYIAKIGEGATAKYFYTQEEWDAYRRGGRANKLQSDYNKQKSIATSNMRYNSWGNKANNQAARAKQRIKNAFTTDPKYRALNNAKSLASRAASNVSTVAKNAREVARVAVPGAKYAADVAYNSRAGKRARGAAINTKMAVKRNVNRAKVKWNGPEGQAVRDTVSKAANNLANKAESAANSAKKSTRRALNKSTNGRKALKTFDNAYSNAKKAYNSAAKAGSEAARVGGDLANRAKAAYNSEKGQAIRKKAHAKAVDARIEAKRTIKKAKDAWNSESGKARRAQAKDTFDKLFKAGKQKVNEAKIKRQSKKAYEWRRSQGDQLAKNVTNSFKGLAKNAKSAASNVKNDIDYASKTAKRVSDKLSGKKQSVWDKAADKVGAAKDKAVYKAKRKKYNW